MIGFVVGVSVLLLAMVFRSVVVPLKAAVMNLLSIGAAYGVLVAVFQWGWGAELLGLDHAMPVSSWVPILMFAILFGLSMDYEVFLLSRIREDWLDTGDPHGSVVRGLSATGRVITAAAAIMVAVFLGFATEVDVVVKMLGVGMAVAIASTPPSSGWSWCRRPCRCSAAGTGGCPRGSTALLPTSTPRAPTSTSPVATGRRPRRPASTTTGPAGRQPPLREEHHDDHRTDHPRGRHADWPAQLRLPGQAAAPEGPVDMFMMYLMHHAFRRDLAAFARPRRTPRSRTPPPGRRWPSAGRSSPRRCTTTTAARTPGCGRRCSSAADDEDRATLEAMEAEHDEIDPLLEACAQGFARLRRAGRRRRPRRARRTAGGRPGVPGPAPRARGDRRDADPPAHFTQEDWERLDEEHFKGRATFGQVVVPWCRGRSARCRRRRRTSSPARGAGFTS